MDGNKPASEETPQDNKQNEGLQPEKTSSADAKPKKELSGKEKKEQAKAEKAARRAAQKSEEGASNSQAPNGKSDGVVQETGTAQRKAQQQSKQQTQTQQQSLPNRTRRPSQNASASSRPAITSQPPAKAPKPKQKQKQLPAISHLYATRRRPQPQHVLHPPAHRDIHPSIQVLALHLESYRICGSQARTIALLLALKDVISGYTTPSGTSLPRNLSSAYLSPQLNHVKSHGRPFCTAQSNAVRWLKNRIATLDPSLPEPTAINTILAAVDEFIRERFTVADRVIAQTVAGTAEDAEGMIEEGDTVVVYGKSAIVCRSLLEAARKGTRFEVVVVDSGRPLWEGKTMLRSCAGLQLSPDDTAESEKVVPTNGVKKRRRGGITSLNYTPISQIHAFLTHKPVSKVLLGANTIYSNGSILSRVGQAQLNLAVKSECPDVVVYVLAESAKCAERAVLGTGSLQVSELAPEHELVPPAISDESSVDSGENHRGHVSEAGREASEGQEVGAGLRGWEENDNLYIVNLLHDVTPPELVDAIITEVGSVPPSSAAAVGRMVGVGGELGDV